MNRLRVIAFGMIGLLVAACEEAARPTPPALPAAPVQSDQSVALQTYYNQVQADLLARGLLRTDGGGPDTPFTATMLARNFENIAFYDEYAADAGLQRASQQAGALRRWDAPVRLKIEFGDSVPERVRTTDRATLAAYVPRLARLTGHPIRETSSKANFHVLVMGLDDSFQLSQRLDTLMPNASAQTRALFANLPRNVYCLVVTQAPEATPTTYTSAVALIRAEHPDLMRKSCLHEEIAQGLGLTNDSPQARPSIFNDDEEFALLTTHDEHLLAMLFDPRLTSGMSIETARPIIQQLAQEHTSQTPQPAF